MKKINRLKNIADKLKTKKKLITILLVGTLMLAGGVLFASNTNYFQGSFLAETYDFEYKVKNGTGTNKNKPVYKSVKTIGTAGNRTILNENAVQIDPPIFDCDTSNRCKIMFDLLLERDHISRDANVEFTLDTSVKVLKGERLLFTEDMSRTYNNKNHSENKSYSISFELEKEELESIISDAGNAEYVDVNLEFTYEIKGVRDTIIDKTDEDLKSQFIARVSTKKVEITDFTPKSLLYTYQEPELQNYEVTVTGKNFDLIMTEQRKVFTSLQNTTQLKFITADYIDPQTIKLTIPAKISETVKLDIRDANIILYDRSTNFEVTRSTDQISILSSLSAVLIQPNQLAILSITPEELESIDLNSGCTTEELQSGECTNITEVTPNPAKPGDTVTIKGSNLLFLKQPYGTNVKIRIENYSEDIIGTYNSATSSIRFTVPADIEEGANLDLKIIKTIPRLIEKSINNFEIRINEPFNWGGTGDGTGGGSGGDGRGSAEVLDTTIPATGSPLITFVTPSIAQSKFGRVTSPAPTANTTNYRLINLTADRLTISRTTSAMSTPFNLTLNPNFTGKLKVEIKSFASTAGASKVTEATLHTNASTTDLYQYITTANSNISFNWNKICRTTNCSTEGRTYSLDIEAVTVTAPATGTPQTITYTIPIVFENSTTTGVLSTVITSCTTNALPGQTVVCSGSVPPSITVNDLTVKFEGSSTSSPCTINATTRVVNCTLTAPNTVGSYKVLASSTTPAVSNQEVATVNVATGSETVLRLSSTAKVRAGEVADIALEILDPAEFISVTARVKGTEDYNEVVYYECHNSVTAISCPTTKTTKITDKRIEFEWDTAQAVPGVYTVIAFARKDNTSNFSITRDITVEPGTCETYFEDVDEDDELLCEAAAFARENGIIYGKKDKNGKYYLDPEDNLTRAEFFAIAERLYRSEVRSRRINRSDILDFRDITRQVASDRSNDWWIEAVLKLDGIVEGYGDGTLRPGRDITIAELAKIVALSTDFISSYNERRSPWYSDIIDAYDDEGIFMDADELATRADAVAIIYDTINLVENDFYEDSGLFDDNLFDFDPIFDREDRFDFEL